MVLIGKRYVNAVTVVCRAPFEATLVTARTDQCVPDELSGARVQNDVHAAFFAHADHVATFDLEHVRAGASKIPLVSAIQWMVGLRGAPSDHSRLRGAGAFPRGMPENAVGPDRGAARQAECDDR